MSSELARPTIPVLPTARWASTLRALDPRVLVPALVLVSMGLVALAADRPEMVGQQAGGALVGIVGLVAIVVLPFRRMLTLAYPLYAFSLICLALLLVPGVGRTANNATRWLQLGPIGFQPSELAKVALVFALARYIRFRRDHRTFIGLFVPFALTLVPLALIVMQPDLGTSLMLVPVLFVMLWAAGAQPRHLLTVVALGVLSIPLVYASLRPYQQERIHTYVAPVWELIDRGAIAGDGAKPKAARPAGDDYHVTVSLAAIAGGGVLGDGFGEGALNLRNAVPESETDFIFSIWAEEWGFLGTLMLLLAECGLLMGLASVAREVREPAGRLLIIGAVVLLGTQALINLAMTVGLAPITGLPLPFLSAGRSSMVASFLLLGLCLNARGHRPVVFTDRDFE